MCVYIYYPTTNPELEAIILAVAEPSSPFWIISVYKVQTCVVRSLRGQDPGKRSVTKRDTFVFAQNEGRSVKRAFTCVNRERYKKGLIARLDPNLIFIRYYREHRSSVEIFINIFLFDIYTLIFFPLFDDEWRILAISPVKIIYIEDKTIGRVDDSWRKKIRENKP